LLPPFVVVVANELGGKYRASFSFVPSSETKKISLRCTVTLGCAVLFHDERALLSTTMDSDKFR